MHPFQHNIILYTVTKKIIFHKEIKPQYTGGFINKYGREGFRFTLVSKLISVDVEPKVLSCTNGERTAIVILLPFLFFLRINYVQMFEWIY